VQLHNFAGEIAKAKEVSFDLEAIDTIDLLLVRRLNSFCLCRMSSDKRRTVGAEYGLPRSCVHKSSHQLPENDLSALQSSAAKRNRVNVRVEPGTPERLRRLGYVVRLGSLGSGEFI
jgi:hypothetical protein